MKLVYRLLQKLLRKLIDWLMTFWLWANKREKRIQERRDYEGK
jgi:hypothetical protein